MGSTRDLAWRQPLTGGRRGFTLIELLVVIAIIAILIGLLLPAVQKVREASSRAKCQNNLKQVGLACHQNADTYGWLPSNGWGWSWVGDPSRGSGVEQPGGWLYQVLPYLEQESLYNLPATTPGTTAGAQQMVATPVTTLNCPTRRAGGPFNTNGAAYYASGTAAAPLQFTPTKAGRTDYAACAGDAASSDESSPGPGSLSGGDTTNWSSTNSGFTGPIYQASTIRLTDILAGTSNTFMVGEKYVNPTHYLDGQDLGDNESMYAGFDNDISRDTGNPPVPDTPGVGNTFAFGSAHAGGFNMAFCDGSVHFIAYTVNMAAFTPRGNRHTTTPPGSID